MLKINEIAYIWGTKKQEFLFKQENSHAWFSADGQGGPTS